MKGHEKKIGLYLPKAAWTKKKKIIAAACGVVVLASAAGVILLCTGGKETYTYKETEVAFGNLTVGVTEDGSVDIGTVEQTFDLDMSALQRVETTSTDSGSNSGNAGGGGASFGGSVPGASQGSMDVFSQIFNMTMGSGTSDSQNAASLPIAEVCVAVGQQVSQGDVLYVLEEESVAELEEQLQSNVEKAEADLNAVYADQELSRQQAQYNLESSTAYGSYAETEYQTAVQELEADVTSKQKALEQAETSLSDYQSQLESVAASYEESLQVLENCQWSLDNTDIEDVFGYVYYYQLTRQAQNTVDSLEQQKEQLAAKVKQAQENVSLAEQSYNSAKRSLEQGLLSAQETLSLRQLAYNTAQETYDIAIAYLEEEALEQEELYAETQEKWEEFSSHIDGNNICAQYDGVITSVDLEAGDSIQTGDVLVTLYNMEEVTMTVTVDEADMSDITVGSAANISFTAYPETLFTAEVTEIADAVADSDGNVTYDVTVTLQGDVSGLFQGMTGEITFVTEETKDVLYVSKRAVCTEGDNSYVKVRNEEGKIEKVAVTTGFTDGVNIEIVEGLSEGDIVLIESKVSGV